MDKDKLKEIITEELKAFCKFYSIYNCVLEHDEEAFADNILAKIPDEVVIASGELGTADLGIDYVSGEYITVGEHGYDLCVMLRNKIREDNLIGKSIRLKLEVLEDK
jgi:hypothetical protein